MKKVLFATTALVALGSMASADVRLSGYGRFGLDYNDSYSDAPVQNGTNIPAQDLPETSITSRLRLQVDMTTETDGGVVFGARFRAQAESRDNRAASGPITLVDENNDGLFQQREIQAGGGAAFNGARFYATYGGFTLGVGNIIGAYENMPGLYLETRSAGVGIDGAGFNSLVGNVNGEYFNWDAYSSAGFGANGVEVLYTAGGFTGHISYSQTNDLYLRDATAPVGEAITSADIVEGRDRTAIMLTYTWNDWTGSIAYQDSSMEWEDKLAVAVYGDIGPVGVRLAYGDNDGIDKWGLYGNFDIGAAGNMVLFVTDEGEVDQWDIDNGRGDANSEGTNWGINYSYDLGGGVSFESGLIYQDFSNKDSVTQAQAGVYFSF